MGLVIGMVIKFIRVPFCVPVDDVLLGCLGVMGGKYQEVNANLILYSSKKSRRLKCLICSAI